MGAWTGWSVSVPCEELGERGSGGRALECAGPDQVPPPRPSRCTSAGDIYPYQACLLRSLASTSAGLTINQSGSLVAWRSGRVTSSS